MRRPLRFGIPLAVLAAATVAGSLLLTKPWQGQEAAGTTTTYKLCNVSIGLPSQSDLFEITPVFETLDGPLGLRLALKERTDITNPKTGAQEPQRSGVTIDPETGQLIFERYLAPSDEDLLKSVLATLRVEPLDPSTAPWPYRDVATAPIERVKDGKVDYRLPDPGAGLAVTPVYTLSADPNPRDVNFILLRNCRSQLWVGMGSGSVLHERTSIHAADQAAFQRFLDEIKPRTP